MNAYPQAGPSNQDMLLGEIRNLLAIVTHTLLLNPADEAARTQVAALNQLQNILQTSALPNDQIEQVRQQLSALAIHQQRQQQTATPPIMDRGQDRDGDTLLQSLRAAGLLGTSQVQLAQPMQSVTTSISANLRNSDLELTSTSLQK
jgi:hypothetical protein